MVYTATADAEFDTQDRPEEMNDMYLVPDDRTIVVVIPAYNEERFIGSVVLQLQAYTPHILVIDDGSTDHTAAIAEKAGATVVVHEQNGGKGVALNTGFRLARDMNPDVVITFDGDYQHLPHEIEAVAAPILAGEADIVVGSRYIGDSSDVPLQRVLGHWGFTTLTNILSGTTISDSQSGFRAFSQGALNALNFSSKSFSVESEMQFLAKDRKLTVVEVPITIKYHDKPKRFVISHGMIVLNGILGLVSQHRPLLFFTTAGAMSLLVGLAISFWVIDRYQDIGELAVGWSLVIVILIILGFSLIFNGIILHTIRVLRLELEDFINRKLSLAALQDHHSKD